MFLLTIKLGSNVDVFGEDMWSKTLTETKKKKM